MKKLSLLIFIVTTTFVSGQNLPSHNFIGEKRLYSIKYGWFKVGKVEIKSSPRFFYENGKRYFDININAGTAGLGGIFTDFKGNFNTKIDAKTLLPVSSFRFMKSSESDNRRTDYYIFSPGKVYIKTIRHKTNKSSDRTLNYATMYDVATAILQCRSKNLEKYKPNSSMGQINVFWNKTVYPVSAKFLIKETMRYDGEKVDVYKLHLNLPESGFIKKGKPVTAWISADGRNIPIKFEAYTRYGTIKCELNSPLE